MNIDRDVLERRISAVLDGAEVVDHNTHCDCLLVEDFSPYFPEAKTPIEIFMAIERLLEQK